MHACPLLQSQYLMSVATSASGQSAEGKEECSLSLFDELVHE